MLLDQFPSFLSKTFTHPLSHTLDGRDGLWRLTHFGPLTSHIIIIMTTRRAASEMRPKRSAEAMSNPLERRVQMEEEEEEQKASQSQKGKDMPKRIRSAWHAPHVSTLHSIEALTTLQ